MDKKIGIEEFFELLKENIREYLDVGEDAEIEMITNVKNNDLILHGITAIEGNSGISPTIYFDEMYEKCQGPEDIKVVAVEIAGIFNDAKASALGSQEKFIDVECLNLDFDNIKDKLEFRVLENRQNRERLNKMASKDLGNGLSAIFYIEISRDENGEMAIPITRDMAYSENYDMGKLMEYASANMKENDKPIMFALESIMIESMGGERQIQVIEDGMKLPDASYSMFVVTNESGTFGASSLWLDDNMKNIGKALGSDYYVIPSSTHEVMVIPTDLGITVKELSTTVKEVNSTQVAKEDQLSDRIFRYDIERDKLMVASDPNRDREEAR